MSKLTEQINHYCPLIKHVINTVQSEYFFTDNLHFQNLIEQRDFAEANSIYVLEIIYRLHAASLITLRRNISWIDSIELSRENSTFFSYCASLRGFIESAADSFYSLRYVPQNLAANFKVMKNCIRGKEPKNIHLFEELEDWGIHFLEAGKYEDENLSKKHFKAKPNWEYLKAIDSEKTLKAIYPLYQKLCQITHPSRETTYLYFKDRDGTWTVQSIDEYDEITSLEESYDIEYEEIFQKSFNSALLSLWIIDQFSIERLKCSEIKKINFEDIGEFKKIKKLISL